MSQPYEGRAGDDDVQASTSPADPLDPVDVEMADLAGQLDSLTLAAQPKDAA